MASKAAIGLGSSMAPPSSQSKQRVALPLHVQKIQRALDLESFISQVEQVYSNSLKLVEPSRNEVTSLPMSGYDRCDGYRTKDFNFSSVTEERQWVKDLLLSPSDESESDLSETEQLQILLELQSKRHRKWKKRLRRGHKLLRYKYFSCGMLFCSKDPYPEHIRRLEDKLRKPIRKGKDAKTPQEKEAYREKLWSFITKKEIPKMAKQFSMARHTAIINCKKVAQLCQREVKKIAAKSQRASKEVSSVQPRARRLMKEALIYWRKYEKVEREQRKKAEKEAMEQRKRDDEMREAKRQQRKLNFLITQTELYAHFIGKKLTGEADQADKILKKLDDKPLTREVRPGVTVNLEGAEEYDPEAAKAQVLANVQSAIQKQQDKNNMYNELAKPKSAEDLQESFDNTFSLATPMLQSDQELPQPQMFSGTLKAYQLKGMNWLANLYDQGINGILADEMGLGKTVQSVAFMAHLAEHQGIWGPFLIVSPASTLHNWQQECTRFVPKFKTLPYWGSPHERKIIRKYWNQKFLYNEHAPFHVLITSYQLVVQDVKYFQRVKWQYMILDEAQAIKSSNSIRWKVLLSFNCRNRLLLTGTPIQNTMQELWALLHFIMPSMFDSHEEFNEWFSRDIESHAEKKSVMDEHQLSRLHLILKPFMLRRIKKDVEHEMAEKIEVHLSCELSTRQKKLYRGVKQRISIDDLLQSSLAPPTNSSRDSTTSHLLNLVMQFRKVCNHPDLFERRNVTSPASLDVSPYAIPRLLHHTQLTPPSYRLTQLGVHCMEHIHRSLSPDNRVANSMWSCFKLSGWSVQDMSVFMVGGLADKWVLLFRFLSGIHRICHQRMWAKAVPAEQRTQLLLWPSFPLSSFSRASSSVLSDLVFVSHVDSGYAHLQHRTFPLKSCVQTSHELSKISSTVSGAAQDRDQGETQASAMDSTSLQDTAVARDCDVGGEVCPQRETVYWTKLPSFLFSYSPKVSSPWQPMYCSSRRAEHQRLMWVTNGGPPRLKDIILHGPQPAGGREQLHPVQDVFAERSLAGVDGLCVPRGWSHIQIPDKECMVFDSGKMAVLDKLLVNLKREHHRVLIYSQMTRMIDLLEEFMGYRRYRYIRLDGSSRISDRRDMVADFQSNSEIFVFLLSTRAGGLGINLTAADTVIFYDSDWNPTVDQQAMDRAHRLGQTKQVTVYRLIVKGTIEEKILQRAREKSEIQKMVISGGDFRPDALKAKEMVSLLLDDDEMETRFLAKQAEKKAILERIEQGKKAAKSKKRPRLPNGSKEGVEPSSKRVKSHSGSGQHQLEIVASNTPSPSPLTLNASRPTSVLSASGAILDIMNGDDSSDIPGSTDGSEVNSEVSGPGMTPVRKAQTKSKLGLLGLSAGDSGGSHLQVPSVSPSPSNGKRGGVKQTSAPLGGRGKIGKNTNKKGAGKGSSKGSSSAASAGARAGAKAATNAAYAAYGIPISPSPVNSPAASGSQLVAGNPSCNSAHSSPPGSPVPMAFVATSLVNTTSGVTDHPSPASKHDHFR